MRDDVRSGAIFSPARTYRYALYRGWTENWADNFMLVIGLNPSTADEKEDDPTIRRCKGFAQKFGFDGLVMMNLFAYRATQPEDMRAAPDPIGPENDSKLKGIASIAERIVCAWGAHGKFRGRDLEVQRLLAEYPLFCLGKTKNGCPKHPLYLPKDTELEPLHDL